MYEFSSFAIIAGGFGLSAAVMLGWVFRTTSAPFALKLLLPAILAVLAAGAPFAIGAMMGYPVDTELASLPQDARLIAFFEHDRQSKVDLWLQVRGQSPRAWRVDEDASNREALADAKHHIGRDSNVYVLHGIGAAGRHFAIEALGLPKKE